jgi:hypothetical protein
LAANVKIVEILGKPFLRAGRFLIPFHDICEVDAQPSNGRGDVQIIVDRNNGTATYYFSDENAQALKELFHG